jgi:hypothetical protein
MDTVPRLYAGENTILTLIDVNGRSFSLKAGRRGREFLSSGPSGCGRADLL